MNTKNALGIITAMMAMMPESAFIGNPLRKYTRGNPDLENIDLLKEYELIKQKKSNLSANSRADVVYIVERERSKYIVADSKS